MSSNIKHNLYNTHSSNRLTSQVERASGGGRTDAVRPCLALGSGNQVKVGGGFGGGVSSVDGGSSWALLCHTNTMLIEFQSLQNTEKNSSRGYCHAIYMLTRLRRQSQVSSSLFFFSVCFSRPGWQWVGSQQSRLVSDRPLPTLLTRWNPQSTIGRRLSRPLTFSYFVAFALNKTSLEQTTFPRENNFTGDSSCFAIVHIKPQGERRPLDRL